MMGHALCQVEMITTQWKCICEFLEQLKMFQSNKYVTLLNQQLKFQLMLIYTVVYCWKRKENISTIIGKLNKKTIVKVESV